MSKTELIDFVAKQTGLTKTQASAALQATLEGIKAGLKNDGKVALIGFGTFAVKERAAREGINPKTKAKIAIPACKTPAFKAGAALKEIVK